MPADCGLQVRHEAGRQAGQGEGVGAAEPLLMGTRLAHQQQVPQRGPHLRRGHQQRALVAAPHSRHLARLLLREMTTRAGCCHQASSFDNEGQVLQPERDRASCRHQASSDTCSKRANTVQRTACTPATPGPPAPRHTGRHTLGCPAAAPAAQGYTQQASRLRLGRAYDQARAAAAEAEARGAVAQSSAAAHSCRHHHATHNTAFAAAAAPLILVAQHYHTTIQPLVRSACTCCLGPHLQEGDVVLPDGAAPAVLAQPVESELKGLPDLGQPRGAARLVQLPGRCGQEAVAAGSGEEARGLCAPRSMRTTGQKLWRPAPMPGNSRRHVVAPSRTACWCSARRNRASQFQSRFQPQHQPPQQPPQQRTLLMKLRYARHRSTDRQVRRQREKTAFTAASSPVAITWSAYSRQYPACGADALGGIHGVVSSGQWGTWPAGRGARPRPCSHHPQASPAPPNQPTHYAPRWGTWPASPRTPLPAPRPAQGPACSSQVWMMCRAGCHRKDAGVRRATGHRAQQLGHPSNVAPLHVQT